MNSAMWHLTQRDMTEHELVSKLKVKTDNQEWIDEVLQRLRDFGYLKSNQDFAEQFVEQSFFGEFGSAYIVEKLKKKGLKDSDIYDAIHKVKSDKNIDEQSLLNDRVNNYYNDFNMSREKLVSTLQKRGFSYQQVKIAIDQHPSSSNLKTNIQIKAEKADLEKEVLKYARKGKGLTAIKQELKQRQIDTSGITELVDRLINEEQLDFYSSCLEQLQKKSYDVSDHKERAKAYAMLTRKGFSSDEIKFALAEVEGSNE
ncbi:recombination regulator RecX (plasmid) [Vibrio sp. THAF190c]|nr:recombination regulator RecX [Vibrio sp. THAF190c]